MTTVQEAVFETREHLEGMDVVEYATLNGAITSGASTLVLNEDTVGIERGTLLSIDEELLRVTAINHSTKTATAIRGYGGSTAAAHDDAAGVEIDPQFPTFSVMRALKNEIRSWGPQLFKVTTESLAAEEGGAVVEGVTGEIYFVLEAGSFETDTGRWVRRHIELVRQGTSVYIQTRGHRLGTEYDEAITVTYAQPFDVSTFTLATELGSGGLEIPTSALDLPAIGAAARLLAPREVPRTSLRQQGNPRIRQEVPPTHIIQTAAALKRWRDMRVADEATRLRSQWPYLTGGGV